MQRYETLHIAAKLFKFIIKKLKLEIETPISNTADVLNNNFFIVTGSLVIGAFLLKGTD